MACLCVRVGIKQKGILSPKHRQAELIEKAWTNFSLGRNAQNSVNILVFLEFPQNTKSSDNVSLILFIFQHMNNSQLTSPSVNLTFGALVCVPIIGTYNLITNK